MGVSIIDGRVDTADIKRENKNFRQYATLRFVTEEGREQTIKNAIAANGVAEHLRPGSTGRFYLFNSVDMRGVYGFRDSAGTVTRAFPGLNERLGLIAIGVALAAIVLYELAGDGTPVIVLIALLLGGLGYFFSRRARIEVERAFAADNPAPAAARG